MNDKIQKVKNKLIELGFIDNEWLSKYLEMLEINLDRVRDRKSTQEHHAIPVNSYWVSDEPYDRQAALKLARQDAVNFKVHLLYKDHLLIHSYLTMCTNLDEIQRHYEAQAELRKRNSAIGYSVAQDKGTLVHIDKALQAKKARKAKTHNHLLQHYSAEDAEEILNL